MWRVGGSCHLSVAGCEVVPWARIVANHFWVIVYERLMACGSGGGCAVVLGASDGRSGTYGGFSKNAIYMNLLAAAYPQMEVFAAAMAQATAVGTALAIHRSWNEKPFPNDIIELKYYAGTHDALL